jgi:hypothetical protein
MALNNNYTKSSKRFEAALDPTYSGVLERGMAMIKGTPLADGKITCRPSAGAAGEVFMGFLHVSFLDQASVPNIETLDIPATGNLTVSLYKAPISVANIRAVRTDTGAAITVVAGAPGAGELGFVGNVLTGAAGLAGLEIKVTYRYTADQAVLDRINGKKSINSGIERELKQVTLLCGDIDAVTSCFDVAAAIDAGTNSVVKLAAGGFVSTAGTGVTIGTCSQAPKLIAPGGLPQAYVGVRASSLI